MNRIEKIAFAATIALPLWLIAAVYIVHVIGWDH